MVFSIHTFVQKTQLSLHIPDSMCFYMSMLIVMLFLFFFLNDTFCIIIHSPTGERKKEYFIQHCVGKNAFQDALCVFFNFIYSSDCRGSQPWRVRSLVAAADLSCGVGDLSLQPHGLSSCSMWNQQLWCMGLVAPQHMGSQFPNWGLNPHPLHWKTKS